MTNENTNNGSQRELKNLSGEPNRRTKLMIDPKFQLWFIGYTSLIGAMTIVGLYVANILLFRQYAQVGLDAKLPEDHVYFTFLLRQKQSMTIIYLVATGILGILTVAYGLVLSNRIVGPLYNLRLYLQRWVDGNKSEQLSFREADHFQDLADSINQTLNPKKNS